MKIEKVEKLVATFHDKNEFVTHIKNLKQALDHWKVHRVNLNLSQQKGDGIFSVWSKWSCYKVYSTEKCISNRNEKNRDAYDVWVLLIMYEFWYDYIKNKMVGKQNYVI